MSVVGSSQANYHASTAYLNLADTSGGRTTDTSSVKMASASKAARIGEEYAVHDTLCIGEMLITV